MSGRQGDVRAAEVGEAVSRYRPPEDVQKTLLGALLCGTPRQPRFGQGMQAVWYSGDYWLLWRPCVAVVGSRDVVGMWAGHLARELAAAGVVVMSGLARGVDTQAMARAIGYGGRVIGVIGTPLDRVSPVENAALQERVYQGDLLVSQFAPGSPVTRGNFPQRNKLMAALSDATVIVEASETSGTIHQARECARLGRQLFVTESVARRKWAQRLLEAGAARVVVRARDVLEVVL